MLGHKFYHQTIRKYVIYFGTLFNDIQCDRRDENGNVVSTLQVPLAYGPKEKTLQRVRTDPDFANKSAINLPRISFELQSMSYAPERKLNTLNRNVYVSTTGTDTENNRRLRTQWAPVPYDLSFDLNIFTRYAEDATQILEQVLPFFTPEWTNTLNLIPEMGIAMDIPVVLVGVASDDIYEGDFETRRALIWNLNFIMKGYLYGPLTNTGVIKHANTNVVSVPVAGDFNDANAEIGSNSIKITPGLDANGNPTTNSSISVGIDNIGPDDNYGFIVDFEDYFGG